MPLKNWKKTLYAVLIGEIIAIAGFSTTIPILPFFLQDLGVKDHAQLTFYTGMIQSFPSISLALMAPIWGNLADSFGRKKMLLRALFGGAVIMTLQGLVVSPWQLLGLRTLQGAITGTVAAATVLVASITPAEEAGYALGLLQMGIFMGSAIGPMLGGILSDSFGHRTNFLVTAFLLTIAGAVVSYFAEDDFVPTQKKKSFAKSLIPDFSQLKSSPILWMLLAVVALDQISGSIVSPFLPLFIKSISSSATMIASNAGMVLGFGALSSAIAAVLIGKVSYRLGYQRVLVVCLTGAAIFTIPQAFVTSVHQLLILRVLSCFFIGGTMPSVNALISQKVESGKQGSIYGLRSSIASASGAIGPALGASIVSLGGYHSVFLANGTILILAGLSLFLFLEKKSEKPTRILKEEC